MPEADHARTHDPAANAPLLRVLLVEDEPADAAWAKALLDGEHDGQRFETAIATDLRSALELLDSTAFDIVLLDLNLPETHGMATFSQIRQQDLPVVILTGLDEEEAAVRLVQAGAQDYLCKGEVNGALMARALRYAHERHRLTIELQAAHQERERLMALRSQELAVAMSEEPAAGSAGPRLSQRDRERLVAEYGAIVSSYVRAVRVREDRPSARVRKFADELVARQLPARDVVRLHLDAVRGFSPLSDGGHLRNLLNDARLLLLEILGILADAYLQQAAKQAH